MCRGMILVPCPLCALQDGSRPDTAAWEVCRAENPSTPAPPGQDLPLRQEGRTSAQAGAPACFLLGSLKGAWVLERRGDF